MNKLELKRFALTTGGINIEAVEGDPQTKPAKFSILAYNGGVVFVGYYGDIVIDLTGVEMPKQNIPILDSHQKDLTAVLGRTESVSIEPDATIKATGILYSDVDETAKSIVLKSKLGHLWESSIGIEPTVINEILAGESEIINGKEVIGPVYVATKSKLKEISIVVHGADSETVVDIAAKQTPIPKKTIMFFNH